MTTRKPYPSDLSDAEWALLEPLIPPAGTGGRRRTVDVREVLDALFYMARTGCQWRQLPHDFPPWPTVHDYYRHWRLEGVWERLNAMLHEEVRLREGRRASPSAAAIDAQSVKTTEKGGTMAMMRAKR
jgi:putative transposase